MFVIMRGQKREVDQPERKENNRRHKQEVGRPKRQ